jgi:hypothetical protein
MLALLGRAATQTCLSNMWSRLGWRGRQARSELSHRSVELGDAIHRMQDFEIQWAQGGTLVRQQSSVLAITGATFNL